MAGAGRRSHSHVAQSAPSAARSARPASSGSLARDSGRRCQRPRWTRDSGSTGRGIHLGRGGGRGLRCPIGIPSAENSDAGIPLPCATARIRPRAALSRTDLLHLVFGGLRVASATRYAGGWALRSAGAGARRRRRDRILVAQRGRWDVALPRPAAVGRDSAIQVASRACTPIR